MQKRIWITWERQRRSVELAKKFNCELFLIEYAGLLKYPKAIIKTLTILRSSRPNILFVQNPSMILAAFACIYKFVSKTTLIVDRHTTFLLTRKYMNTPKIIIFKLLHRFTIRHADLTIVTNDFLANLVSKLKGRPFVLPDKLPELSHSKELPLKGKRNILLISSFGMDEPIKEALESMRHLKQKDIFLYITGNYRKLDHSIYKEAPENVVFTDYLAEQDFSDMLFSVDAVMVLTTAEHCMLCGCYESVSAGKPLITSNKKVLREYFTCAVFVDNTPKDIADGIERVFDKLDILRQNVLKVKQELICEWEKHYICLENKISAVDTKAVSDSNLID